MITNLVQTTRLILKIAKKKEVSKYKLAKVCGVNRTYFTNAHKKGVTLKYINKLKKHLRIRKQDMQAAIRADLEGKRLEDTWDESRLDLYIPKAQQRCSYCGQIKGKNHGRDN